MTELIGGTGSGKSHLATALGVEPVGRHGKRARFYSTIELANGLEQEKSAGMAGHMASQSLELDLLILNQLGYLTLSQAGRRGSPVPPAVEAVRAHQRGHHHQPGVRRVGQRRNRRQDDHGAAEPADPPRPHRRDREQLLPVPAQRTDGQDQDPGPGTGPGATGEGGCLTGH